MTLPANRLPAQGLPAKRLPAEGTNGVLIVGDAPLRVADVVLVAHGRSAVGVSAAGRQRAAESHRASIDIAQSRPVYGRTTGVGANRDVTVAQSRDRAVALLRSHATSAGPLRSTQRVRAMLVIRLAQLAAGGSGASPAVLDSLVELINSDAVPAVREHVGIGTGDLAALAQVALTFSDELMPGDALAFLSSNAATLGDAALCCDALARQARAAIVVAALTFAAVDGNPEAFAAPVEQATPFRGAQEVCRAVRRLLGDDGAQPSRIQDPYGLRAFPQVHGALLDALAALAEVVVAMSNAPSENPLIIDGAVAHHGAFHAAYLAQALDAARSALAQDARLSLARLSMLIEPEVTGLPPFLGDGTPGASGVMLLEYVAASALGSLEALARPAALGSVTLSRGVEDDASFASLAARQALDATADYRTVLACELVAAVRAVRMRDREPRRLLGDALHLCTSLPADLTDRDLTDDIQTAMDIVDTLDAVADHNWQW